MYFFVLVCPVFWFFSVRLSLSLRSARDAVPPRVSTLPSIFIIFVLFRNSVFYLNFFFLVYFIGMNVWPTCMYMYHVSAFRDQKRASHPLNWSYRWMCVVVIQPTASERVTHALTT